MEHNSSGHEHAEQNPVAARPAPNPYILPASILIAAFIVGGAIVYMVHSGNSGAPGSNKFPVNAFSRCIDDKKYASVAQDDYNAAAALGVNSTPTTFVNGSKLIVRDAQGKPVLNQGYTQGIGSDLATISKAIDDALAGKALPDAQDLPLTARDAVIGDANAKVTVIEYGDYQCPFCAQYHTAVFTNLYQKYISTGKIKFVFRNFPFLGPESYDAAAAAECAKDQGKFWEYHEALYAAEAKDGREHNGNLNREFFLAIAQEQGLKAK